MWRCSPASRSLIEFHVKIYFPTASFHAQDYQYIDGLVSIFVHEQMLVWSSSPRFEAATTNDSSSIRRLPSGPSLISITRKFAQRGYVMELQTLQLSGLEMVTCLVIL
jgi:hypothetical protein